MENNKYYTPTNKELHIGLECQQKEFAYETKTKYLRSIQKVLELGYEIIDYRNDKKGLRYWNPIVLGENGSLTIVEETCNTLRVKYLDKEDIEKLGWKFIKHWIREEEGNIYYNNLWGLTEFKKSKTISIWTGDTEETKFDGTIKNKSQLKQLMTWLNITPQV